MVLHVAGPSGATDSAVDIRVAQRGGEIQVTVHTADPALQANLRQDLPSLVNSLDRAGFDAQTFVPHANASVMAAGGSSLDSGSAFGQSSVGGQTDSGFSSGNNAGSGGTKDSGSGGQSAGSQHFSGQDFGQNSRDRQNLSWLDQIEE